MKLNCNCKSCAAFKRVQKTRRDAKLSLLLIPLAIVGIIMFTNL